MRIGEGLQQTLEDLEPDRDPPKVNIRGEYAKTGNPRIAFISMFPMWLGRILVTAESSKWALT
ncbi:MAG: hypothetical protein ACE5Z5_08935 [Candidatus Bathyarchaeia archaeon]